MSGPLDGKVAIVTGGGKGIGGGIARVFAVKGAKVLVADYDEAAGMKSVNRIKESGGEASFVKADVTKREDLERMAQTAIERYGRIDILAANAGIYQPVARIEELTEKDWDRIMDVNLKGVFLSIKAVLPQMLKQKYGRIVVTSSTTGNRTAILGLSHYASTKGGVNGLIKNVAFEMADKGITVNGVEPGNVLTDGIIETVGEEYIQANLAVIPMGRMATPEDIAYPVAFLASDEASYITGQTIVIDGGQTLPESAYGANK